MQMHSICKQKGGFWRAAAHNVYRISSLTACMQTAMQHLHASKAQLTLLCTFNYLVRPRPTRQTDSGLTLNTVSSMKRWYPLLSCHSTGLPSVTSLPASHDPFWNSDRGTSSQSLQQYQCCLLACSSRCHGHDLVLPTQGGCRQSPADYGNVCAALWLGENCTACAWQGPASRQAVPSAQQAMTCWIRAQR